MAHIQSEKLVLVQFCFHESQFCCPAELPFASNTQYSASHCGIHKLVVIAGGAGGGGGGGGGEAESMYDRRRPQWPPAAPGEPV